MTRQLGAASGLVGLQAPLNPQQALIHLMKVNFGPGRFAYITDDTRAHTFNENIYQPFPVQVGDYFEAGDGEMTKVRLTIYDLFERIDKELEGYRGFDNWTVEFAVCFVPGDGLEPIQVFGWNFNVTAITIGGRTVVVELGQDDLELLSLPHRWLSTHHCQLAYKGALCGSTSPDPTCDHGLRTPNGCVKKENWLRFGAQPGSGGVG